MANTERNAWLDYSKAIGIFLVVYGHSQATGLHLEKWIYSFHMPLFFLIAGYLVKESESSINLRQLSSKLMMSLGPAYLVFAILGYVAWVAVLRKFGNDSLEPASPWPPLAAIFYGTGTPKSFSLEPRILWFLPCLVSARLLAHVVFNSSRHAGAVACVLFSVAGLLLPQGLALPWELESALVAQGFIVLGVQARRHQMLQRISRPYVACLALLTISAICSYVNVAVDMRQSRFGNPLMFYAGALSGSAGVCLLFRSFTEHRVVRLIAEGTLVIFPLHTLAFSLLSAVYVYVLGLPLNIREQPVVGLLASLANVALLTVLSLFARKYAPWIFGLKQRSRKELAAELAEVG